jgi:hypothetical protein
MPPKSSRVAPVLMVTPLTVAPESIASTPPLLTVVLVSAPPLVISSVPALMVQWAVLALLTVRVPPTTLKMVKP